MIRVVQREKKLAVIRSRLVLIRHRHLAPVVELDARVNLVSKRLAVYTLPSFTGARGVPTLNHELPNDAVEHRVVVILQRRRRPWHRRQGKTGNRDEQSLGAARRGHIVAR